MESMLKEYVAMKIAIAYGLDKKGVIKSLDEGIRGRPKRYKKVISSMIKGENLIERLISEAKIDEEIERVIEEDEEEIIVKNFEYKGEKYLKAEDDTIYNKTTHDEIGRWNRIKGMIEFM